MQNCFKQGSDSAYIWIFFLNYTSSMKSYIFLVIKCSFRYTQSLLLPYFVLLCHSLCMCHIFISPHYNLFSNVHRKWPTLCNIWSFPKFTIITVITIIKLFIRYDTDKFGKIFVQILLAHCGTITVFSIMLSTVFKRDKNNV